MTSTPRRSLSRRCASVRTRCPRSNWKRRWHEWRRKTVGGRPTASTGRGPRTYIRLVNSAQSLVAAYKQHTLYRTTVARHCHAEKLPMNILRTVVAITDDLEQSSNHRDCRSLDCAFNRNPRNCFATHHIDFYVRLSWLPASFMLTLRIPYRVVINIH